MRRERKINHFSSYYCYDLFWEGDKWRRKGKDITTDVYSTLTIIRTQIGILIQAIKILIMQKGNGKNAFFPYCCHHYLFEECYQWRCNENIEMTVFAILKT